MTTLAYAPITISATLDDLLSEVLRIVREEGEPIRLEGLAGPTPIAESFR